MADHGGGYEQSEASIRYVIYFLGSLAVFAVIAQIALGIGYRLLDNLRDPGVVSPLAPAREVPPEPRLQVSPAADLSTYLAQQGKELAGQGSRQRIPIQQAKQMVLKSGFAARSTSPSVAGAVVGVPLDSGGLSTVLPEPALRLADPSGLGSAYPGRATSPGVSLPEVKGGDSEQKLPR